MLDSRTLSRISVSWDLRYYMWGFLESRSPSLHLWALSLAHVQFYHMYCQYPPTESTGNDGWFVLQLILDCDVIKLDKPKQVYVHCLSTTLTNSKPGSFIFNKLLSRLKQNKVCGFSSVECLIRMWKLFFRDNGRS